MLDIVFVVLAAIFFAITIAYVRACNRGIGAS